MGSLLPIQHYCNKNVLAPTPIRVRSQGHGFSHGLKSVPRTLFTPVCALVPPFRILSHPLPTIKATPLGGFYCWQRMRDSNSGEFQLSLTKVIILPPYSVDFRTLLTTLNHPNPPITTPIREKIRENLMHPHSRYIWQF